jgi:hypothetical protein
MGALTLSDYQTEVRLALGNMQTSHPLYSGGIVTRAINQAANDLVRMAIGGNGKHADLFPELRNSWTVGPTIVGDNSIARPSDCIVVTDVVSAQSSTLPDWADTQEQPVGFVMQPEIIGQLSKDSTIADYPRLWARKANRIVYHPTTRTGYTDYFRFYGLASCVALAAAADTFPLDAAWDNVIVLLASYSVAAKLGWTERATGYLAMAKTQINETANVATLGNDKHVIEVENAPTRSDVYGGF